MRLFLVLLYASLVLSFEKALKCFRDCSSEYEVSCSSDKTCYFQAENDCVLEIEVCLRKAYRMPRFIEKMDGYCLKSNYPKRYKKCIPMTKGLNLYFGQDYGPP